MDKIFKRVPKATPEGDKEAPIVAPALPATPTNDTTTRHKEKPLVEGHTPKFAWKIKPQSDGKAAKNPTPEVKDIPDDLWIKCPHCKELLYNKEFENNKKVCHKCGHHFRLSAVERVAQLVDEGSFEEINGRLVTTDPLGFTSLAEPPYALKSVQTRQKTGLNEALLTGFGQVEKLPLALAVIDFSYQGGTMGGVTGEKLVRLIELAIERHLPLLTVSSSGGARMHEGVFSLMQMAKTTAALAKLGEAGLPHFSLFVDPCIGGVTASYASVADIVMAEPGALIGLAGPRVIEQVIKQKLPVGFQTAEFLLEHGMLDQVVPRKELRGVVANLLKFYQVAYVQAQVEREVAYAR